MSSKLPSAYYETMIEVEVSSQSLPDTFAIITAYNPMDEPQLAMVNTEADGILEARVKAIDPEAFRATGHAPDFSHSEPGWGVAVSLEEALVIALEFEQRALWWIENGDLHLVSCHDPVPHRVAKLMARLLE